MQYVQVRGGSLFRALCNRGGSPFRAFCKTRELKCGTLRSVYTLCIRHVTFPITIIIRGMSCLLVTLLHTFRRFASYCIPQFVYARHLCMPTIASLALMPRDSVVRRHHPKHARDLMTSGVCHGALDRGGGVLRLRKWEKGYTVHDVRGCAHHLLRHPCLHVHVYVQRAVRLLTFSW